MTPVLPPIRPEPLRAGDQVRVVAPSRSLAMIGRETREVAQGRFTELGLGVSFGDHVEESDEFASSSVASRIADLHAAFRDPKVKAILSVIGGYNANQLLPHLDWELIKANPKIVCGYSDITALTCSIWAKTGLVTYSGPHYSTFGMLEHFDQTLAWFTSALMTTHKMLVKPARSWTDDPWYVDQHNRRVEPNEGYWVMGEGAAQGHLVGGNLCTLNLLHGTEYMPGLEGAIVFVEDDCDSIPQVFERDLTSLTQQPGFEAVAGVLIGRFQRKVGMDRSRLAAMLGANRRLARLPILANVDFGHTDPLLTLPIGGTARVDAVVGSSTIEIL